MEKVDEKGKSTPIATGFVMTTKPPGACLITCKHAAQLENLWVRFNAKPSLPVTMIRGPIAQFQKQGLTWVFHPNPNIDLAAIMFYEPENGDVLSISPPLFGDFDKTAEGDDIFFMGFPLGITGQIRVTPVVRSGIIALKRENLTYLIDANAFPGSSGSPVFLRPSLINWKEKTFGKPTLPKLVGVIHSALTYTDYAISPQTRRPRVSFEENAALAEVYSIEIIKQLMDSSEFQKQQAFAEKHPQLKIQGQIFKAEVE